MQMENQELRNKIPSPDIYATLTREEQEAVAQMDSIKQFSKGSILVKQGAHLSQSFYVVTGLVRKFRHEEIERTLEFYTDQESIFTVTNNQNPIIATFGLECVEDSKVSVVSFEIEQEMYRRFPRFERMCRMTTELEFQNYQERIANFISWTPEQRYLDILNNRADLVWRVPQYQLASYLGITPESLSRIRKRIASKGEVKC